MAENPHETLLPGSIGVGEPGVAAVQEYRSIFQ